MIKQHYNKKLKCDILYCNSLLLKTYKNLYCTQYYIYLNTICLTRLYMNDNEITIRYDMHMIYITCFLMSIKFYGINTDIKHLNNIYKKICECWGNKFSFEYIIKMELYLIKYFKWDIFKMHKIHKLYMARYKFNDNFIQTNFCDIDLPFCQCV